MEILSYLLKNSQDRSLARGGEEEPLTSTRRVCPWTDGQRKGNEILSPAEEGRTCTQLGVCLHSVRQVIISCFTENDGRRNMKTDTSTCDSHLHKICIK